MKFSPINDIVKLYTKSRFRGIQKFLDNPLDVQRDMLAKMVKSAASTEYGKQYGFKFIKNYIGNIENNNKEGANPADTTPVIKGLAVMSYTRIPLTVI